MKQRGGSTFFTRIYGSSTGIKENDARPRPEQTRDARPRPKTNRERRLRDEGKGVKGEGKETRENETGVFLCESSD